MGKINLLPVKKSLVTAAAGATFLAFSVSTLASSFTIELFTNNPSTLNIIIDSVDERNGNFSGEAVGSSQGEVWEVNGRLVDGKVELELENLRNFRRIIATGEIQDDGMLAGRAATAEGELFEWEAADALVTKSAS